MGSSASKTTSSTSSTSSSPPTKFTSSSSSSSSPAVQRAFSFPMPLVHHPPSKKGDTHHLVSLTSTTYGSLLLIDVDESRKSSDQRALPHLEISGNKVPDLPTCDSFSPDSVINTWELMDGLDDEFDFDNSQSGNPNFSLNLHSSSKSTGNRNVGLSGSSGLKLDESYEFVRIEDEEDWIPLSYKAKQPLWKHLSEESFLSDLDPNIVSSYKKALSSKQLNNNGSSRNLIRTTKSLSRSPSKSIVISEQESVCSLPLISQPIIDQNKPRLPGTEDKIVLYFTSLRGIRKTYEDCCCVRTILRGLQVTVDERDISMDSKYRKELQSVLGAAKPISLPQVFIKGTHVGGVEEIKQLNDGGELAEICKDFPACKSFGTCQSCGDARFVPCSNCDGSTKVFEERDDGFKRCPECNENGLVRCREC